MRALARDPDTADLPDGVEVVAGDLSDAVGLAPHLDGVDAVFLLWPFPTVESVRKLGPPLIDTLAAHVGRDVYLSATSAAELPGGFWRSVELIEASLAWAHPAPDRFRQERSHVGRPDPRGRCRALALPRRGALAHPRWGHRRGRHPGARRGGLVGAIPVISGREAITPADQIAEIATAIGRELRYEDMPRDEAVTELAALFGNTDFAGRALMCGTAS